MDCVWAINTNTHELKKHTEYGKMTVMFSTTQGVYATDDPRVTSPIANRFDKARLYISQLLKYRGDDDFLVGPDFTGIDEVACSFSSSKKARIFTECCTEDSECASGNCYMNEYCSDTCLQPPFWHNSIYYDNGFCCVEDRECVSFNCYMGTCALKCYE